MHFLDNKKPSEIAALLDQMVTELGTAKAVADKTGLSTATVSRYRKIKNLSENEQQQIDAGEKPLRKKRTPTRTKQTIADRQIEALHIIARLNFTTSFQLGEYMGLSESIAKRTLETVCSMNYVKNNKEYSPAIFSLSERGYKYLGKGKIRWYKSSAAIHQQLMRNTIELKLRNQNSTIHFLSNADAYKEGFYPSVGEHPFTYVSKDDLKLGLAIIDDYGMEPSRVVKTLTREHDKERRSGKNLEVKKWMDHINILYVFTTSETRKTRFLTYLQKLQSIEEVTIGFKDTQLAIQAFAEKEGMNKVVAKKLFKRFDSISQVIKLIKIEFVTPIWEI